MSINSSDKIYNLENLYSANNVITYPLNITHGEGVYLFDYQGRAYLDMATGISVASFGHNNKKLIKTLTDQASQVASISRLFHNKNLGLLLEKVCKLTDMEKAVPMSTGAEAVETALKAARKWVYTNKKVANNMAEIIVCNDNFHGRTISTISMSSTAKYKNKFEPLTPGFVNINYNDTDALLKAINYNTAAIILEPIQGEAGIILPDKDYLSKCAELCKKHQVLLIVDEIQTGMGRTGKFLASQHYDIQPDGILLGKALGGGLLPMSLFLAKNDLIRVFEPGDHGSTFSGNPLASAVAAAAIDILQEDNLMNNAATLGNYFLENLQQINTPLIKQVRGLGLLIGMELNTDLVLAKDFSCKLIKSGLINISSRNNVIRLFPPLNINKDQINIAIDIIKKCLDS